MPRKKVVPEEPEQVNDMELEPQAQEENTEGLTLPPKHFFAARQTDGSHRFYGSNGP